MKKSDEEIIEILVAYDATECAHSAARVAGCDPKTVRRYVAARDAGRPVTGPSRRSREIDAYMEKIEEWVDRSEGHISAVRAYQRLLAMGYTGSERTTRRAVSDAKTRWRAGNRRTFRPWISEPGLWLQFDWGEGPAVPGPDGEWRRTALFCAWLPWSRLRVVIPCWDRSLATVTCALDTTLRALGGAPTYLLTRPRHHAGIRHPDLVAAGRHYGTQVRVCAPYEPESAGGGRLSEVRIAAPELVPTEAELRREYPSFTELRTDCAAFTERSNLRAPLERAAAERARLHPLPAAPYTAGLGRPAQVAEDGTVTFDGTAYPVPSGLAGAEVWLRAAFGELSVVADLEGLTEIARHRIRPRVLNGRWTVR